MPSLPEAIDQHERLPGHLAEHGITEFTYHDAFGPDAPEVKKLYDQGIVMRFPPCFRCGNLRCDNDDCNNVLIPPQVANFASFMALWAKIAETPQTALVLEDDVLCRRGWKTLTANLAAHAEGGEVSFVGGIPELPLARRACGRRHFVGFGSTACANGQSMPHHDFRLRGRELLSRSEHVDQTSDMFLHKSAPRPGEALTVFPPVASDLSWSEGSVESFIHPKEVRVRYLSRQGHQVAAASVERQIQQHRKHIFARDILCVGHPRSGTGYIAELCRQTRGRCGARG